MNTSDIIAHLPAPLFFPGGISLSSEASAAITIVCHSKPSRIFWPLRSILDKRATTLRLTWDLRYNHSVQSSRVNPICRRHRRTPTQTARPTVYN